MRITRIASAVAVGGIAALVLAGCNSADASSEAESITIWHNSADTEGVMALYENFTDATGIDVELVSIPSDQFEQTVQTKWATGDRPDVLEYHATSSYLAQLNAEENLVDLSDMDFSSKSGTLYDEAGALNGTVYAAITGFPSVFGVFYNKDVFAAAGVDVPQTFDDLVAACGPLEAAGAAPFYESGGSLWPTQIMPSLYVADQNVGDEYGQELAHNEASVSDPDGLFVEALEAYEPMRETCFQDSYSTGTFENAISEVYSGSAAMTALHSDTYDLWVEAAGGDEALLSEKVGFSGLSKSSATSWYSPGPLGTYMVPRTGDEGRESAAKKFIEYATGDGYEQLLKDNNAFPVIDGYAAPTDVSELKQSFQEAYQNGATIGFSSNVIGFGDVYATEMGKMLAGESSPEQAASAIETNVERASKAAGVTGW